MNEKPSKEHISVEEVKKLVKKHSLLIYHSFSRNKKNETHEDQIIKWGKALSEEIQGLASEPIAIRVGKYSPRAFFLVSKKKRFNNAFKKFAKKWETFGISYH